MPAIAEVTTEHQIVYLLFDDQDLKQVKEVERLIHEMVEAGIYAMEIYPVH